MSDTFVLLALNEDILGPVESVFVIVIDSVDVAVLPLESVAVKVNVCVVVPYEKLDWEKVFVKV